MSMLALLAAVLILVPAMACGGPVSNLTAPLRQQQQLQLYAMGDTIEMKGESRVWVPLLEIGAFNLSSSSVAHTWPELEFNWRVVLATVLGFLGAGFGSIGGVGGGGIFVPLLCLVVGFDQKSSTALSKCMIMGASAATVWYTMKLKHPTQNTSLIDYDLALIFQPMLMLGISIGVIFNVIFPNWLVTILLIVLFTGTSSMSFAKGLKLWKEETVQQRLKKENTLLKVLSDEGHEGGEYKPIRVAPNDTLDSAFSHIKWKVVGYLVIVWFSFLALQILKTHMTECSAMYWVWVSLQVPVAYLVFSIAAFGLYKRSRNLNDEQKFVCSAEVTWTFHHICLCSFVGIIAGVVGGLLGLGGGFIMGPLFLELGVPPQVSSATATFVMLFSSSMSVVEYHLIHRFPVPFALYLCAVSILAGFFAQYVVRRLVLLLGRASIIIFTLSVVIFISALTLGGFGIQDSIIRWQRHEYMGFINLCSVG